MHRHWMALVLACVCAARPFAAEKSPAELVEPRVDTQNARWIFFASASRPFGMVSLSPDTKVEGDWGAGYIYASRTSGRSRTSTTGSSPACR